jgi:pimeloyl-ACP methyl ester carboxylesterase
VKVGAPDGVELEVHEAGRSDGKPVLLLHGYSANANVWASTHPALAPRFRVLMPDFRGHGASGRTEDPKSFTLEQLADDTVAIADAIDAGRFTLMGHGMGGEVAQIVALENQDRIEALVLVDTGAGPLDPSSGWALGRAQLAKTIEQRGITAGWEQYVESGIVGWEVDELPIEIVDMWRAEFMKTAPAAFVGLSHSMSTQADRANALAALKVKTLVVAGADDDAFGEASRVLARAIPGAELAVIDGAGHSPQIMKAEEFNGLVVDFLKRAVPAGRGA